MINYQTLNFYPLTFPLTSPPPSRLQTLPQGYNARKVILEMYTSFVLQCTVSGR